MIKKDIRMLIVYVRINKCDKERHTHVDCINKYENKCDKKYTHVDCICPYK